MFGKEVPKSRRGIKLQRENKRESLKYWIKVIAIWLVMMAVTALVLYAINKPVSEKADEGVERFIQNDDGVGKGLRIASVCKHNHTVIAGDMFAVSLVCDNVHDSDTFEVVYNSTNPSSDIEAPSLCTCEGCKRNGYDNSALVKTLKDNNLNGEFNPTSVTGKQLKEGCLFSLKNQQSAVIVGLPDNTSYKLTDLTGTKQYDRESINARDAASAESMVNDGVITGVYNVDKGVETIGFMRIMNNTHEAVWVASVGLRFAFLGFLMFVKAMLIADFHTDKRNEE